MQTSLQDPIADGKAVRACMKVGGPSSPSQPADTFSSLEAPAACSKRSEYVSRNTFAHNADQAAWQSHCV